MILLDTHVAIWFAEGEPLAPSALRELAGATPGRRILVSAVSAWEIAMLHASGRRFFSPTPELWLDSFREQDGIRFIPLDHGMAAHGYSLPGAFHRDPADRFLVATARVLDVPIMTRDAAILAYGRSGHVAAMAC